jgi:hypothetical protein
MRMYREGEDVGDLGGVNTEGKEVHTGHDSEGGCCALREAASGHD